MAEVEQVLALEFDERSGGLVLDDVENCAGVETDAVFACE